MRFSDGHVIWHWMVVVVCAKYLLGERVVAKRLAARAPHTVPAQPHRHCQPASQLAINTKSYGDNPPSTQYSLLRALYEFHAFIIRLHHLDYPGRHAVLQVRRCPVPALSGRHRHNAQAQSRQQGHCSILLNSCLLTC